jgi:hypothetical protein
MHYFSVLSKGSEELKHITGDVLTYVNLLVITGVLALMKGCAELIYMTNAVSHITAKNMTDCT